MHDRWSGGLFTTPSLAETGVKTAGFEIWAAMALLLGFFIIAPIVLIRKTIATSIIGFILGLVLLLYMPLLAFALTFNLNLFGGPRNSTLQLGYYVGLFAVVSFVVILLLNMIAVIRGRNNPSKTPVRQSSDLLDDTDL